MRDVDDAITMIGTAIVDAHDHRLGIAHVGDADVARHRQRRMRRRHRRHVEDLAIRRQAAMKFITVPGCHSLGAVAGIFFRNVEPAGNGIRFADPEGTAASWDNLARFDHARRT